MILTSVLFPAPLSPTRATTSPWLTLRLTPSSACTWPNALLTSLTRRASAPAGASLVPGGQIVVFASFSLEKPFQEIGKLCAEEQGGRVSFQFASSSVLEQQIQAGDRVDVFACAGVSDLGPLISKNLINPASVTTFASNEMVVVVAPRSSLHVDSFQSLALPAVKKIATADLQTTEEILTKLQVLTQVKPKLRTETIDQILADVAADKVDAGILYSSDAKADGKVKIVATSLAGWHQPISYAIGTTTSSRAKAQGEGFIRLVDSAEGQDVFARDGFLPGSL